MKAVALALLIACPLAAQAWPLIWAFGLACYSISPKGATLFRDRLLPRKPLVTNLPAAQIALPFMPAFRPVGINNHMHSLHRPATSYLCFPPLVAPDNGP